MLKKLIVFFYFSTELIFSQNHIVVDATTKQPLAFASVTFFNDGLYTNEHGEFSLSKTDTDSITVSYIGYVTYRDAINKLKDSIFLTPKTTHLKEVEVVSKRNKKSMSTKLPAKTNSFGSWPLSNKTELLSHFALKDYTSGSLQKILLVFDKLSEIKHTQTSIVRINLYNSNNGNPAELLFSSNTYRFTSISSNIIEVELSDIFLNQEGIFIGVEYLGNINTKGEFVKNSSTYVRPRLSKKKEKVFKQETYFRYVFKDRKVMQSINSILSKSGKNVSRNLALEVEFVIH